MSISTSPSTVTESDTAARRRRLEGLFEAHGRAVFAFARRRASAADADEVVSETFLVAWRRLDDVPDEPRPWLLGVARRCLANINRRELRQSALQRRLVVVGVEPAESGSTGEVWAAPSVVLDALDLLSAGERDALTLLAWEGLTPSEVGAVLGCSRAAVYLRLGRARRRVAAYLRSHPPEEPR